MANARGGVIASDSEVAFATSPVALLMLDNAGAVTTMNSAAEEGLNTSGAASRGVPIARIVELPPGAVETVRAGQAFSAYRCDIQPRRSARREADVHLTPIADGSGRALLSLHLLPGRGLADGRGPSRAAIGAAAMLAHEIKNPLAGIRGAAQLLGGTEADDGLTDLICGEVDRIVRLIDRMERFTDPARTDTRAYNVHAIVDHAIALARAAHGDALVCEKVFDPSLPPVLVDRDALVQVLLNLIANAVEARTSADVHLRVETRYRHGVATTDAAGRRPVPIEIAVIDDGPGAPPAIVDQLFEPFVTGRTAGRGLGLALVDKLIRDCGGTVRYAREGSPPVTVFRMLLPRA